MCFCGSLPTSVKDESAVINVEMRPPFPPADEQQECADDVNRWMAEGKLAAQIGRELPLAETAAAHRLQEENTLGMAGTLAGKIVLVP